MAVSLIDIFPFDYVDAEDARHTLDALIRLCNSKSILLKQSFDASNVWDGMEELISEQKEYTEANSFALVYDAAVILRKIFDHAIKCMEDSGYKDVDKIQFTLDDLYGMLVLMSFSK